VEVRLQAVSETLSSDRGLWHSDASVTARDGF
jgi:hypothetical protein